MAAETYVALRTVTVTSATTSVTLDSIPSTYSDLRVEGFIVPVNNGAAYLTMYLNGENTGTNYSSTQMYWTATGTPAGYRVSNQSNIEIVGNQFQTLTPFSIKTDIINYTSNSGKAFLAEVRSIDNTNRSHACSWRNNAVVNSITYSTGTANASIGAGSTFTIYGIRAEGASPAAKATGGVIYSDSTYYYHVFAATSVFTPLQSLTADILVVAGGGQGGGGNGGGGGAGGLLAFASQALTATAYNVTVGAGGSGGGTNAAGGNGSASQFASLTATAGGGGGGGYSAGAAVSGGSGGGGGTNSGNTVPGNGTAGQGNNGGSGHVTDNLSGGGGGAGAVGGTGTTTTTGAGGNGSSAYSAWGVATGTGENVSGTHYYAGGGSGGGDAASGNAIIAAAGLGGGGLGGSEITNATAGKTNTGGGGGGEGGGGAGANGGSGIVIVRYAKA
jgi:hypothetical protein